MNQIAPAVIGHNSEAAPLAELLAEETAAIKLRAEELAAAAGRAKVVDDDTAGRATTLAKMINEHRKDIDAARVARKEPFLVGGRTVDTHFKALDGVLAVTDAKGKVIGGPLGDVLAMLDTYRREQEAKAAEERRRLEEEARRQREAAEAAERARREAEERAAREAEEARRRIAEAEEAARKAGDREAAERAAKERAEAEARAAQAREEQLRAETEARQRQEEADRLARQAEATKAGPIDSGLGAKASGRKSYVADITDFKAALKHAVTVDEASIRAAVQGVYDRQVRAGVRSLPGAEVKEVTTTVVR